MHSNTNAGVLLCSVTARHTCTHRIFWGQPINSTLLKRTGHKISSKIQTNNVCTYYMSCPYTILMLTCLSSPHSYHLSFPYSRCMDSLLYHTSIQSSILPLHVSSILSLFYNQDTDS